MPIPVAVPSSTLDHCSISTSDATRKLIQIILRARLGTQYGCAQDHLDICCFGLKHHHLQRIRGSFSVVVHILQKTNNATNDSGTLLERWIMSLDPTTTTTATTTTTDETDAILLLQAVYSHTRLMPVHTLLSNNGLKKSDLAAMITVDGYRCYSRSCPPNTDFPHSAHIKTHQFLPKGRVNLKVMYLDAHADEPSVPCGVAMRRLSRLSLSAIEDDTVTATTAVHEHDQDQQQQQQHDQQYQQHNYHHPFAQQQPREPPYLTTPIPPTKKTLSASIPIPNMQYTHHHGLVAYSTSPSPSFGTRAPWLAVPPTPTNHLHHQQGRRTSWTADHGGSLVGSYEESLLSGRMSAMPSKPILFQAQIGVLGKECKPSLRCPPHRAITFPAFFYDLQDHVPPYVGTVDLLPPYRLPPKGQLQVVIKNPNKTAVKLFLIPYDVSDMPKNTKTFLRQKSYDGHSLRYAVQVQLCRTEKKRVYLYKHIRVVFANRIADAREKLKVTCEGPQERGPLTRADLDLLGTL
ncbi:hypothetical protein BDB00DRAFT_839456 [Zychaea mexicana]|uniref:uncharacterized protein n=1 Tax=Zychaea mexicana TaxID=64656 RepID=UPI0022FF262D|nr:uncharacterized protein BDB00DRAFT_839456 [Zychaea mexicana]KAI9490066.1 hypothetical protein BDB00DRAFT_839456 [Zychaea mexicana]